ncbi:DUF7768 domain-containing protein [Lacrimispora brassicae]
MIYIYDVIIIGAGPAGLAAGTILKDCGMHYVILEKGKNLPERDAQNPCDISSGVGGCGLFSDGKLSFAPSASSLWTKLNKMKLIKAYSIFKKELESLGISVPSWEDSWTLPVNRASDVKKYNSIVLNNFMRTRLLNFFYEKNLDNLLSNKDAETIEKVGKYYEIKTSANETYCARKIILATGRFGNKILKEAVVSDGNSWMEKIELGIRLETPTVHFKPYKAKTADYKVIKNEKKYEFRTFCSCKSGVVVQTKFDNYVSFNGAQTQFKTEKSNIGLLIRSVESTSEYEIEMKEYLEQPHKPFKVQLKKFLEEKNNILIGKRIDQLLRDQIGTIVEKKDAYSLSDSYVYGPEIEYVGDYIKVETDDLSVNKNIYIVGDVNGGFRGLTAAMISGLFCANELTDQLMKNINKNISQLGIKASNINGMKQIFTAQSKNYFYCKDVICQYVLNKGMLPINPFMIFGYFLNDRVERDLIRQGNNQLIQKCDELWVFGPIADGVLFEIALAKQTGKPVRYFKLGTRESEINEIDPNDINSIVFEPEVHSKQIKKNDLMAFIQNKNIEDGQLSLFDMYTKDDNDDF